MFEILCKPSTNKVKQLKLTFVTASKLLICNCIKNSIFSPCHLKITVEFLFFYF